LDKITIKFETLHQFSVVKSCHVSKNNQLEVVLCILCKEVVFTLNVSISCEVFVFFVVPTRINAPLFIRSSALINLLAYNFAITQQLANAPPHQQKKSQNLINSKLKMIIYILQCHSNFHIVLAKIWVKK